MKTILRGTALVALCCFSLAAAAATSAAATPAAAKEVDPESGFIIDDNWELVKAQCTVCHSSKLVTEQRGARETWESIIRWMQKTQGLWEFEPVMEGQILDYLARNYPPGESYRRKPLAPELMPPE